MKKDNRIHQSIDENLSSVHFDAVDMHRVLRAVRDPQAAQPMPARRRRPLAPVFAAAMAALIIVPVSLLVLRAGSMTPADITTITSHGATPAVTASATLDPLTAPENTPVLTGAFTQDHAIAAARACFEAHCDTSVFSFDEYTVSVQAEYPYGEEPEARGYLVTMNNIYHNGCTFSVTVSASGDILAYSTPRLATVPTRLSSGSEEILAWYDQYGEKLYTWPLEIQAEFSRRYEGALLRAPHAGEASEEAVRSRALEYARSFWKADENETIVVYCTLLSERASSDALARYQVYCFCAGAPDDCLLVTMLASSGEIESAEIIAKDSL